MLGFYTDPQLTRLIQSGAPKEMQFTLNGGSKTTVLYLGDPEDMDYFNADNIIIYIAGSDTLPPNPNIRIALGAAEDSIGIPGVPLILGQNYIFGGVDNAIPIYVQVTIPAGVEQQFTKAQLECSPIYSATFHSAFWVEDTIAPYTSASFDIIQWDMGMPIRTNMLPLNRQLLSSLPGFVFGQYRWRDHGEVNAQALVPTIWNPDVNAIGPEKFIYGIGVNNDLVLDDIEEPPNSDSINPRVNHGTFWTGYRRYFYPSDQSILEFLPCGPGMPLTFTLQDTPRTISPVFVGTWALDDEGFYEYWDNYRYTGHEFDSSVSGQAQFTLNRATNTLVLNQGLPSGSAVLGLSSGEQIDYFQLPIHPIARLTDVIALVNPPSAQSILGNASIDYEQGTVIITWPSDITPTAGLQINITYDPAVAIYYEIGVDDGTPATDSILGSVELNPAFSGISQGYLYLQNARQIPESITLVVDKPPINIGGGLTANGPIYFNNDYALLTATVYGDVPGEVIPGVTMVVADAGGFEGAFGYINYIDPEFNYVTVVSGGDGVANMVYTPPANAQSLFGVWFDPTASISGAIINLGEAPDSSFFGYWDVSTSSWVWTIYTYQVLDNDPLLGMKGADPTLGQIPWLNNLGGPPGDITYRTNGQLSLYTQADGPAYPVSMWDGLNGTGTQLNVDGPGGMVQSLVYANPLPIAEPIGAYYVSLVATVSLYLQDVNSNVRSNTVYLRMQNPTIVNDNPFLILAGTTSGGVPYNNLVNTVLNLNRLAFSAPGTTPLALTPRF